MSSFRGQIVHLYNELGTWSSVLIRGVSFKRVSTVYLVSQKKKVEREVYLSCFHQELRTTRLAFTLVLQVISANSKICLEISIQSISVAFECSTVYSVAQRELIARCNSKSLQQKADCLVSNYL